MRRIELPATLAFGTAERLHRLGVIPAPASDLQYVVHPWVVASRALREAGWLPAYDNPTVLGLLLEQVAGNHALGGASGRQARRHHRRRSRGGGRRHGGPGADRPAEEARMSEVVRLLDLRDTPLSVDEVFTAVSDPAAGGVALFVGTVRSQDDGRGVTGLDYSAHPTALDELRVVAEEVAAAHPVLALAAVHRVGDACRRRPRRGRRRLLPAPRRGVHGLPGADRRAQVAGAGLEAPELRRRRARVGGSALIGGAPSD